MGFINRLMTISLKSVLENRNSRYEALTTGPTLNALPRGSTNRKDEAELIKATYRIDDYERLPNSSWTSLRFSISSGNKLRFTSAPSS